MILREVGFTIALLLVTGLLGVRAQEIPLQGGPLPDAYPDHGWFLKLDSSGRVYLGGSTFNGVDWDPTVARYTRAGELDLTFGTNGKVQISRPINEIVDNMIVGSDDSVYLVGFLYQVDGTRVGGGFVTRVTSTGQLDTQYGEAGWVEFSPADVGFVSSAAFDADGKLLLVGGHFTNGGDIAIVRLTSAGGMDSEFGTGGIITLGRTPNSMEFGHHIAVANGKVYVAAYADNDNNILLLCLNGSGALDASFGNGGLTFFDGGHADNLWGGLSLDAQGAIYLGGATQDASGDFDAMVLKFTTAGALDPSFGNGGVVTYDSGLGDDEVAKFALDSESILYVAFGTPSSLSYRKFDSRGNPLQGFDGADIYTATTEGGDVAILLAPTGASVDTEAPVISEITPDPGILWLPNHKMVPVVLTVSATDNRDPAPTSRIVAVESSEPEDGKKSPDWIITGDLTLELRAERNGTGTGRIYTVTVECVDASGNVSQAEATVVVPKSLGARQR